VIDDPPGDEPRRSPALARPYAWTEGRTAPSVEIAVEALVETTADGRAEAVYQTSSALSEVLELCVRPRSLMEIAALLGLPLGVVRVLVSDLMQDYLVIVRDTLSDTATWDERHDLMERVLHGLRDL
jgi:DNA-directed RNA polymerase specialized sigma24 family protein